MKNKTYIVATIRPWNIKIYEEILIHYPGNWYLITKPEELTEEFINKIKPRYIFFPHWSQIIPSEILNIAECIGFHETDLPYGRGGSPIQNLIVSGHTNTQISAIKLIEKVDAGPVYLKRPLSLEGLAEEIFIRTSKIVAEMILEIITKEPKPKKQKGISTVFKRRKPAQSEISTKLKTLKELFDHIRMLDACGYPIAFLRYGDFKFELSRPALRSDSIEANVRIIKIPKENK
jgi:methionyl-tRNA formyltransferase